MDDIGRIPKHLVSPVKFLDVKKAEDSVQFVTFFDDAEGADTKLACCRVRSKVFAYSDESGYASAIEDHGQYEAKGHQAAAFNGGEMARDKIKLIDQNMELLKELLKVATEVKIQKGDKMVNVNEPNHKQSVLLKDVEMAEALTDMNSVVANHISGLGIDLDDYECVKKGGKEKGKGKGKGKGTKKKLTCALQRIELCHYRE